MYKTRLDPPPANGWVPSPKLLELTAPESMTPTTGSADEEEFTLVAPEPPQPRLDFSPDPPTKRVQLLLVNGEQAEFVRKRKEDGKLFITARMLMAGVEKTFTVPPAKVKILEDK